MEHFATCVQGKSFTVFIIQYRVQDIFEWLGLLHERKHAHCKPADDDANALIRTSAKHSYPSYFVTNQYHSNRYKCLHGSG